MARYSKELGAYLLDGPAKEAKETVNKREVVRVFVFRSKSTEEIKKELAAGADPTLMSFITVMWAEKNAQAVNPHQVMPVGGRRKDQVSAAADAARELMEETHLRARHFDSVGEMEYTFRHPREGDITNKAAFFATEIVPSDIAYSLHPEEDKIKGFHYLDAEETARLFVQHRLAVPGAAGQKENILLLDSLRTPRLQAVSFDVKKPSPEETDDVAAGAYRRVKIADDPVTAAVRLSRRSQTDEAEHESAFRIQMALMKKFQQREYEKKKDALAVCAGLLRRREAISQEEVEDVFQAIDAATNLEGLMVVYVDFFKRHDIKDSVMRDIFCRAFDLANFKEEVRRENAGDSRMEAVLRLVYTMMNTEYYDDAYLDTAGEITNLKDFVGRLRSFLRAIAPQGKSAAEQAKTISGARTDQVLGQRIVEEFQRAFDIPADEAKSRLDDIDRFLHNTVREAADPLIKGKHSRRLLEQTNEVQGATLQKLLEMAFPTGGRSAAWKERYRGEGGDKKGAFPLESVVFEARRKLAMLYLFGPTEEYYRQMRELNSGNVIGEAIFEKVSSAPVVGCDVEEIYDRVGNLLDIKVKINGELSSEAEMPYAMIRRLDGKAGSSVVRYHADVEKLPIKELDQLFRKMIVRGFDQPEQARDLYRRSIVLVAPVDEKDAARLTTREKRKIAGVVDEDGGDVEEVEDIQAVLDVVETIAAQANTRVVGFKSTPQKNERLKSRGAGGKGEVRFAKFYIEHKDAEGNLHYEEVQVYAPSEDGKSGFYHKRKKEADDERYFFERLLQTRGLRSFMELLFPAAIYGRPVHLLHRKRAEGNG